jgi:Lrp/AsnC family transcriptional regulator for asnA, asnC and gidA
MTTPVLDELDMQLIDILSQDARLSNRKIANELGVTEGTVRGRIKKLQQERLIAFTAITSPDLESEVTLAFIGVQTDIENMQRLGAEIAEIPGITGTLITMGRFNILAICLFENLNQLYHIASEQILALSGVHHVETSIAVKTIKYNSRIVRITETDYAESIDSDA